ncbi:sulfatase-like hydrolase/transferase [Verrucomicrobiaceae bacterium 5K15]|uniref:Sulfatase-like hydrolase/transferase n=1 Tax=Oceaniferula flava TaxID=2800421 RepID=A0AAE2VDZ1_9BACT|nr:sulfatase-like hydrolase/transferase [Oceaniferula flavus]MBK1855179.1 sulfatase-like hydrolase/transferase [Oceaniferula flavus]MBM1136485.1 sulfatase-like hydrolase/transferase [Oceaniferula flavus]
MKFKLSITLLLSVLSMGPVHAKTSGQPNILLIYVDDMGYGDLACYGSKTETPQIDKLAAEGICFTNYLSASNVCSPSRAAVLTGHYPQRVGLPVCPNGKDPLWNEHVGLPLSEVTLAEVLKPQGYATAAFGKWHLGEPELYGPLKQGFDRYVGSLYNFPVGKPNVWLHNDEPQGKIMFSQAHQKLTDATISFMNEQQQAKKPFFIYLAHYLVHGPWSPNKQFCTDAEWASYQKKKGRMNPKVLPAMVRELDHHVGQVMAALKSLGIEDDTIVIFASDNGPWLPAGSAEPFSEGKYSTMEGGHRVPAMIRWPGHFPAGQVSDEMVSALDLMPTIAAATGSSLPEDRRYDGYDLLPLLSQNKKQSPRQEFFYYNGLSLEAVRRGPWKLHLPRKNDNAVYWALGKGGYKNLTHPVLNHLPDDLAEKKDVTQEHPEQTDALQKMAAQARKELGDWDQDGSDRPANAYPGNLNQPHFIKKRRKK